MLIRPQELLRGYLQGLARCLGAPAASLFVPATGPASPILLHVPGAPAVDEVATLEAAGSCLREIEASDAAGLPGSAWALPSATPGGLVVRVPCRWALVTLATTRPERGPRRRRSDLGRQKPVDAGFVLVGLALARDHPLVVRGPGPLSLPLGGPGEGQPNPAWILALIGAVASQAQQAAAVVDDPVSGLPSRLDLLASLDRALDEAREAKRPLTLMLVNPDELTAVNERFGREAGDQVMREVARRISTSLRASDRVARYGGASFAALLSDTSLAQGKTVAEKSLGELDEAAFLGGAVRLGFSLGIATFDPADPLVEGVLDLIRRADQALYAAKRAGGGRAMAWQEEWRAEQVDNLDRLTGIFTGNSTKDYRNMSLLLDVVGVIAASPDLDSLARQVVDRLFAAVRPDRIGIFESRDGRQRLLHGRERTRRVEHGLELDAEGRAVVEQAVSSREPVKRLAPSGFLRSAVPLLAGDICKGCLYLDGRAGLLAMDQGDLIFLKALASQLAVAADRAELAEQERSRQERERRLLQNELDDLRRALQEAKLVYRSPQMEALLGVARRVAPTDATVLITGESGTGKELLARTIHEVSPRHKHPLVVVDCSAIPPSLIESELFGHERGAYTGADRSHPGRLAEANGGSVLLDEIGELPLEVQSRLLRFVQEKQLTPVGGSAGRFVDARLIASTNRDLAVEVAQGRFREDLYHRLNVVRLVMPPLRQRPDDILHLAEHFRQIYALLYRKPVARFTAEAEALLVQASWPGNVRELQNRIMQAVILSESEELGAPELGLPQPSRLEPVVYPSRGVASGSPRLATVGGGAISGGTTAPPRPRPQAAASPRGASAVLREAIGAQIEGILEAHAPRPLPLGRWLSDDVVLAAAAESGPFRRAASTLGVPETTFRRRLERARGQVEAGLAVRPATWQSVQDAVASLVREGAAGGRGLLAETQRVLLEEVLARTPADIRFRSALLGVTVPTYRRRLNEGAPQGRNSGE